MTGLMAPSGRKALFRQPPWRWNWRALSPWWRRKRRLQLREQELEARVMYAKFWNMIHSEEWGNPRKEEK